MDSDMLYLIKRLTPVEDVIVNRLSLNSIKINKNIKIEDFSYKFIIDSNELNFFDLSDGTKRILYSLWNLYPLYGIKINDDDNALYFRNDFNDEDDDEVKLLLWEEPEIGLHPHQLFELMNIVKEQSKYKQILISTHSPIVLNCLAQDELDRIIICDYIKGQGTKLRHLTIAEIKRAQSYMDEEGIFLSDYWMHSELQQWKRNA